MQNEKDKAPKVLIVVSNVSHAGDLNNTEIGVWLEEFAVPYYIFKDAGFEVAVASPLGGEVFVDPESLKCENPTEWDYTIKELKDTKKLSDVDYMSYDAIFFPGGHSPMFDIANDDFAAKVVSYFYNSHKVVAAVCHGPAGLINAVTPNGQPIVKGMQLTSLTNEEEKLSGKDKIVPFMLESKLRHLGAIFNAAEPNEENVVVDENLITGQNPASSKKLAEAIVKKLLHWFLFLAILLSQMFLHE